jgi:replication-associated recombination protein RarA
MPLILSVGREEAEVEGRPVSRQLFTALAPLAERMRPRTLDEMVGQRRLLAPNSALRRAVEPGGCIR